MTRTQFSIILGITESTVKKHVQEMFEKLGVETRGAATVRALEVLNAQPEPAKSQNTAAPALATASSCGALFVPLTPIAPIT